jgi:hypothetical protein
MDAVNIFGNRDPNAGRQRQLDGLLEAVEQAQQGARALCNSQSGTDMKTDAKLLFGRLEAVRVEVEQLRQANGMGPFKEIDPKWTGLVPGRLIPDC